MSYLKVNSYQGKWNIGNSKGVIAIQTEDGVSHSTKELNLEEYSSILEDFRTADKVEYNPNSTQYITTRKLK